jgi:hypothetical protein
MREEHSLAVIVDAELDTVLTYTSETETARDCPALIEL